MTRSRARCGGCAPTGSTSIRPTTTTRHAARGGAGHLRRADRGGQGARHRGVELHRSRGCGRRSRRASADGLPRYESLQPQYNLYDRADYETELEPLCVEQGLGVICYFGLAKGFLTGKYRSSADLGQSPRGGGIARLSGSSAACAFWRRWTRWRPRSGNAGAGGTGLADRAPEHHSADRQRDLAATSSRI